MCILSEIARETLNYPRDTRLSLIMGYSGWHAWHARKHIVPSSGRLQVVWRAIEHFEPSRTDDFLGWALVPSEPLDPSPLSSSEAA